MQIRENRIQELMQDPENCRSHDEKNLQAIKESLAAFGQQKPIVIDQKGKVVAGNGTLQAAKQLGWETIKTVVTDLEGKKQAAFAIADNRTAELAAWNETQLAKQLESLGEDIDLTGFQAEDLEDLMPQQAEEEPAEVAFSEYIDEANNYVVLVFSNEIDWLAALTHFDLQTVASRRANGKPWSQGVGRVIDGAEYLQGLSEEMLTGDG
jgi:hypothetical protein